MTNVQFDSVPIGATIKVVLPTPLPTTIPTVIPTIQPTPAPTSLPTPSPTPSTECDNLYINYKEYVPYMDELLYYYDKDHDNKLSEIEYTQAKDDGNNGYLDMMERSILLEMYRKDCTIRPFTPPSTVGSLKVDCLQPKTTIEYNGQTYLTPHTFTDLPYGSHTFNLSKKWYDSKSFTYFVYYPDIKKVRGVLNLISPVPTPIYCNFQPSRSLQSFRDVCISNEEVSVEWNTIEGWMIDKTVACYWWDLSEKERRSIAAIAIKNNVKYEIRLNRYGSNNCGGAHDPSKIIHCSENTNIRCCKFGVSPIGCDSIYYGYGIDTPIDEMTCYYTDDSFNLPTYRVVIEAVPINPDTHKRFYHAIAGIQISKDTSTCDAFIFFQYSDYNEKPGDWHIPTDGFKTDMDIYDVLDMSKPKQVYVAKRYHYKLNY